MNMEDFSHGELKAINDAAVRAYTVGRGVVDLADCQQEAWLWVFENLGKVEEWRETDKRHEKLRTKCYHAGLAMIRATMRDNTGAERQDFVTYTTAHVSDMLPVLFTGVSFQTGNEVDEEVKHKTAPNEGGNGLATLMDIRAAFIKLGQEQKRLLFALYSKSDSSYEQIAKEMNVSSMTVRRREAKALEQIVDLLGGPRAEARRKGQHGSVQ